MTDRLHASDDKTPVLAVRDLKITFPRRRNTVTAVGGVSLEIWPGEIVGVIGESGSGKSMTALSVMRLLPYGARMAGQILLAGEDIATHSEAKMRALRGDRMAMIPQDALQSLNPSLRVGFQIGEPMSLHNRVPPQGLRARVRELMTAVRIPRPDQNMRAWPHEFSGGMQQRAMIATGLALHPQLIIADEPTTALDVTVQAEILDLLREIRDKSGAGIMFITHDLGVVAELCDYVYVMNKGQVVEHGRVEQVLTAPRESYTQMLLNATPSIERRKEAVR